MLSIRPLAVTALNDWRRGEPLGPLLLRGHSMEKSRKYAHNEIAEICRDEVLQIHNLDEIIYSFSKNNSGVTTTDEKLRENFAAVIEEKFFMQ